jgi:hypothetical protein
VTLAAILVPIPVAAVAGQLGKPSMKPVQAGGLLAVVLAATLAPAHAGAHVAEPVAARAAEPVRGPAAPRALIPAMAPVLALALIPASRRVQPHVARNAKRNRPLFQQA